MMSGFLCTELILFSKSSESDIHASSQLCSERIGTAGAKTSKSPQTSPYARMLHSIRKIWERLYYHPDSL